MKVITSKDLAATAAVRFKKKYFINNDWIGYKDLKHKNSMIYFKLVDLGSTITPKQVKEITGYLLAS